MTTANLAWDEEEYKAIDKMVEGWKEVKKEEQTKEQFEKDWLKKFDISHGKLVKELRKRGLIVNQTGELNYSASNERNSITWNSLGEEGDKITHVIVKRKEEEEGSVINTPVDLIHHALTKFDK